MQNLIGGLGVLLVLGVPPAIGEEPFRFRGDSELPLIILDSAAQPILNEPKIDATLSILNSGDGRLNTLSDVPTTVTRIRIEIRGSSSQFFEKKSYSFETVDASGKDRGVSLLGLPRESDWILYGPYSDKTLMRNYLAYDLSNKIGRYAPRTRFAEVFVRDTQAPLDQQYAGVYLLVESIKRGKDRVDVRPLKKGKRQGLSGGYILKIDRVGGPETYFTSELGTILGYVAPRGERLDDEQRAWIKNDFSRIERTLAGHDFLDPQDGYSKHVDVESFIDHFLLNELFKNVDAYFLSTFLHKQGDGKLAMGPIWDLDLSSGNASYGGVWNAEGWMLFPEEPRRAASAPFWWDRLLEDPSFRSRLLERWRQLRGEQFSEDALFLTIDDTARSLDSAQRRNFERWPVLGSYVWPNPRPYATSYSEEVRQLKTWFAKRIEWMDANIEPFVANAGRAP